MRQCDVTFLSHRDRQDAKARAHREVLMLIRRFAAARRLMMYAARGGHVVNLPRPAEAISKIEILTGRAAFEERRETADCCERFTSQRARTAADPFARDRLVRCR